MHYIRFVKFPQVEQDRSSKGWSYQVSALVTVETDLGEKFLEEDIGLNASFRADTAQRPLLASQKLSWKKGLRLVKVQMKFQALAGVTAGILCVSAAERRADDLRKEVFPNGVLSTWSPPIPLDGTADKGHVERKLFLADSQVLSIWEETGESIARHVWDGGLAFASYAALNHDKSVADATADSLPLFQKLMTSRRGGELGHQPLRILELGTGVGVAGLTLAALLAGPNRKPHITITDLEAARDIANRNVQVLGSDIIHYEILDWDKPLPDWVLADPIDLVLFADCIYNTSSIPLLVKTLSSIAQRWPRVLVVFAYKVRHDSEGLFFDLVSKAGFETREHILFGGTVDMYTLSLVQSSNNTYD